MSLISDRSLLRHPLTWGWIGTIVIFAAIMLTMRSVDCVMTISAGVEVENCVTKWDQLKGSTPNEIGDTLAGFAGSLAFLWIVVTVLLQSQELRAQRLELEQTRQEMKEQRQATQDLARSTAATARIFEDEQKDRLESRNLQEFIELVSGRTSVFSNDGSHCRWRYNHKNHQSGNEIRLFASTLDLSDYFELPGEQWGWHFSTNYPTLIKQIATLKSLFKDGGELIRQNDPSYPEMFILDRPVDSGWFQEKLARLESACGLVANLSKVDKLKFENSKIVETIEILKDLISHKEFFGKPLNFGERP